MSRPGIRGAFIAAVLIAITACLAACSGDDGSAASTETIRQATRFEFSGDAATIDGEAIPASVIADTLAVFTDTPAALQGAFGESELNEAGSDQPKASIVASVLSTEIAARVIATEVARQGLTVDDGATAVAQTQMKAFFGDALDGHPDYLKTLVDRYALYVTLDQTLGGSGPDESVLRAAYDDDPSNYDQACARHILVESEAQAQQLLTRLQAGEDFATLAKANSTDTGSAVNGGDLGCQARGVYVAEFEDAIWNGELNTVQGPIKTEFGYHLIEVRSRGPRTFEEARDDISDALSPEPFAALGTWLNAALPSIPITVDPRFGTWEPASGQVTPVGVSTDGLSITPASTTPTASTVSR